jgi:hypothetical protein
MDDACLVTPVLMSALMHGKEIEIFDVDFLYLMLLFFDTVA